MAAKTIADADALLLYRVGPVFCCSPTMPVVSVQMPPRLSHPPGSSTSRPGVFRFASGIVRVIDLRHCFGVDEEDWDHPGKIVVTEVSGGLAGFWVDEIIDVIQCPQQGWGSVPTLVPADIFTRTLLFNGHIQLYAELENFENFSETGYLRRHIQVLKSQIRDAGTEPTEAAEKGTVTHAAEPIKQATPPAEAAAGSSADRDVKASPSIDAAIQPGRPPAVEPNASGAQRAEGVSVSPKPTKTRPAAGSFTSSAKPLTHPDARQAGPAGQELARPASASVPSSTIKIADKASSARREGPEKGTDLSMPVSVQPVGTRKAEVDYGLWVLLVMLLVTVVVGVYFVFGSSGQAPVYPGTGSQQVDIAAPAESPGAESDVAVSPQQVELIPVESAETITTNASIEIPANSDQPSELGDTYSRQSYRATINQDDEGLVIVLDVPDEEPLIEAAASESLPTRPEETTSVAESAAHKQAPESVTPRAEKKLNTSTVIHVVVKGDTLWHIARRYIHNPWRYPELARLSRIKNPDLIYPGDRVKIIINKKSSATEK